MIATLKKTISSSGREIPGQTLNIAGTKAVYDTYSYDHITKLTGHGCSVERGGRPGGYHKYVRKSNSVHVKI